MPPSPYLQRLCHPSLRVPLGYPLCSPSTASRLSPRPPSVFSVRPLVCPSLYIKPAPSENLARQAEIFFFIFLFFIHCCAMFRPFTAIYCKYNNFLEILSLFVKSLPRCIYFISIKEAFYQWRYLADRYRERAQR